MTAAALVPAVGGTGRVPAPDPVATEYILLGLRLDQHLPGIVDGYYGPADLKAQVDMDQPRSPALLRTDAAALAERVDREVEEADRRAWLAAQLVALEAHARALAGDLLPYTDEVARCMGFSPSPECPISEGLADIGLSIASPPAHRADLLVELFQRADMPVAADATHARDVAERAVALAEHRETLGAIRGNAALRRHADGAPHDEVLAYLCDVGRYPSDVAAKRLEFIEHPLWRTYAFVYAEGQTLLQRWIEAAPAPDRVGRFGRLLHEQVTPGRLLAELG